MKKGAISQFIEKYFLHFNAAKLKEAAAAYVEHLEKGGKMMLTLAGAMSTAELGKLLATMIREDKVHIISCTGANLEEDIFNLVAHNQYKQISNYQDLSVEEESALLKNQYNRVADTCIPEEEAMRKIGKHITKLWQKAYEENKSFLPHEYIYQLIDSGVLKDEYQIDPKDAWVVAACEKKLPIVVPGWEDSTLGNFFAAHCMMKNIKPSVVKPGTAYMIRLADWYMANCEGKGVGFFQIGGGIAGDFPICVVPMLYQDLQKEGVPFWNYFCQISDSHTSYGSYSGAVPNEKITWGKLGVDTPRFIIESDATIVAPLIFAYVLNG
ncbi:MAG: deoxyhypusine synthase family protein [Cytophagales bacterium]|nr:deoxyhypusine synthase family protein [Cytophagales bacterium]